MLLGKDTIITSPNSRLSSSQQSLESSSTASVSGACAAGPNTGAVDSSSGVVVFPDEPWGLPSVSYSGCKAGNFKAVGMLAGRRKFLMMLLL